MLVALACAGVFLFVLGVAGSIFSLICRIPLIERFLDDAFENIPLGREEVQRLEHEDEGNSLSRPVPHRAKRLVKSQK